MSDYDDVVTAVINAEPTDANYGGWDILISVPTGPNGEPGWACVEETKDAHLKDIIVNTLRTVHFVLANTRNEV